MKDLKITPPEGYEIDKENSTFDCIKFKLICSWRNNKNVFKKGYAIGMSSIAEIYGLRNTLDNKNVFATEKQAKSALAMAQISQIIDNDKRFGGPITDEEWQVDDWFKYIIVRRLNDIVCDTSYATYQFLAFHTGEQRALFLKENEDLVKDYLML